MDPRGQETKGVLEVANQNEAIGRVKEMGLFPTKIVEVDKEKRLVVFHGVVSDPSSETESFTHRGMAYQSDPVGEAHHPVVEALGLNVGVREQRGQPPDRGSQFWGRPG